MDRSTVTFAQAEGLEDLPKQLNLKELDKKARALIWASVFRSYMRSTNSSHMITYMIEPWNTMLQDYWVECLEQDLDKWSSEVSTWSDKLSAIFKHPNYAVVLDKLQFFLRHPNCPKGLHMGIEQALLKGHTAYRLLFPNYIPTITPVGTEAEAHAVSQTFADLSSYGSNSAARHLKEAVEFLNNDKPSKAVSESIHAVECIVRKLVDDDSATLGQALLKLKKHDIHIHRGLEDGLKKLYGYTSDEKGVRHALAFGEESTVDEADALFMFGACASFVSYLLRKGRSAGLLSD